MPLWRAAPPASCVGDSMTAMSRDCSAQRGGTWPIDLVTKHARTIMAGTPTELERVAAEEGLLAS
jgi:hypothetical protein